VQAIGMHNQPISTKVKKTVDGKNATLVSAKNFVRSSLSTSCSNGQIDG
jgi:hypothetical protein